MTITPYPEPDGSTMTSGWSGSDASHERAVNEDRAGVTRERQQRTLGLVDACGFLGVTVKELREITGWHHGQASSVLSVLHKEGRLERLAQKRDRCHIYVMPADVRGREVQPHGRQRPAVDVVSVLEAHRTKAGYMVSPTHRHYQSWFASCSCGWVSDRSYADPDPIGRKMAERLGFTHIAEHLATTGGNHS